MAIFTIPKYKMHELETKIEKIRNKGADIIFHIIDDKVLVSYKDNNHDGSLISIPCVKVEVNGHYIMNGWAFVGTIEHSSPENIIRLADKKFSERVPEKYRTTDRECEHCYMRRDRNDTFLVYNEDADEWKQVGRTCLKNYAQGLDAEVCAQMMSIFSEIGVIAETTENGNFDINLNDATHMTNAVVLTTSIIKKQMLQYIKDNGYTPINTVELFKEKLFGGERLPEASDTDVQAITNATQLLTQTDWSRNAIAVWNKTYIEFRDLALLASLCSICLQKIAKEAELDANQVSATNNYAGEVGDTVEFEITSALVAYTRTPQIYGASSYPVYRITDDNGKIYTWGCTNSDIVVEPGKTIRGKIKATYERKNGEKVTELTRCKIFQKE